MLYISNGKIEDAFDALIWNTVTFRLLVTDINDHFSWRLVLFSVDAMLKWGELNRRQFNMRSLINDYHFYLATSELIVYVNTSGQQSGTKSMHITI